MLVARFVTFCVAIVLLGCKPTIEDTYNALPAVGTVIPDFRYTPVDGTVLTPAALRGRPAVVALWATTCSASRLALASLAALEREYASRGARVVILADDQDQAAVSANGAKLQLRTLLAIHRLAGAKAEALTRLRPTSGSG